MKKLPGSTEIKDVGKAIKSREFTYIANFADVVNRFVDILLFGKESIFRLRWGAMSFLIVKGGSLSPSQLSQLLFRSKNSITKVVDSLEKDGLIIRTRVNKDRRTIRIKITLTGLEFVKQTLLKGDILTQEVLSCLSKDERKVLVNLIRKMRRTMIGKILNIS
jgi:DNA-binding MarR family transcriptional regulator